MSKPIFEPIADSSSLDDREAMIMDVLWSHDEPTSILTIMDQVNRQCIEDGIAMVSYGSLDRALKTLVNRGLLQSTTISRKNVIYKALVGREEMAVRAMDRVSRTILKSNLSNFLPRLLGAEAKRKSKTSTSDELKALTAELNRLAEGTIT